jgi:hypothetical protein
MGSVGDDPRWEGLSRSTSTRWVDDISVHVHSLSALNGQIIDRRDLLRRHYTLTLTKADSWGLVYVWSGKGDHLEPVPLTAQQGTRRTLRCVQFCLPLFVDACPAEPIVVGSTRRTLVVTTVPFTFPALSAGRNDMLTLFSLMLGERVWG